MTLCGTTKEDYLNSLKNMEHDELAQRCYAAEAKVVLSEVLIRFLKTAVNDCIMSGKINLDFLGVDTPEDFIYTTCEGLIKEWVDDKIDS